MASFSINETYEKVIVEVKLAEPPKGLRNKNKQSVTVADVLKFLQKSGIKVGECTQKTTLSNFGDSPTLSGFFVFDSTRPPTIDNRKKEEPKVEEPKVEEPKVESAENLQESGTEEVTKVSRKRRRKRAKSEKSE